VEQPQEEGATLARESRRLPRQRSRETTAQREAARGGAGRRGAARPGRVGEGESAGGRRLVGSEQAIRSAHPALGN